MSMVPPTHPGATLLVTKLAASLVDPVKGLASKMKEKLEVKLRVGFTHYIEEQISRFSHVKNIISQNLPLPLASLYVNLHLQCDDLRMRDEDFIKLDKKLKPILFTAIAGSGKSMMMRYLFLKMLETQDEKLPVFIELRDLNLYPSLSLMEFIRSRLASYIDGFSENQLKYAFETAKIILLLDGFDEIEHDNRVKREREIQELAGRYGSVHVFISSRPLDNFQGWERFFVFQVQPLSKNQVELLIEKIPYDNEIKINFMEKLKNGLYEEHQGFLSNPLLCTMMLITITYFSDVPAKVHIFYGRAFDALFGRHDTTKGGFIRKMYTSLAADEFKKLFSYFCAVTYMKQKITFTSDELTQFINIAVTSSQISTASALFKNDLIESTCMLIPDGLEYAFSHRSFQEYFTAYFLTQVAARDFARTIPVLVQRTTLDNVVSMLFEMNNEEFERSWALPQVERMCDLVDGIDASTQPIAFGQALFGKNVLLLVSDGSIDMHNEEECEIDNVRITIYQLYGIFDEIHRILEEKNAADQDEIDSEVLERIKSGELLGNDTRFNILRSQPELEPFVVELINPDDSIWYGETYFGRFLTIESDLLSKLRNELRQRVSQRNNGLEMIYSDLKNIQYSGFSSR